MFTDLDMHFVDKHYNTLRGIIQVVRPVLSKFKTVCRAKNNEHLVYIAPIHVGKKADVIGQFSCNYIKVMRV